jgi:hypothetical protein
LLATTQAPKTSKAKTKTQNQQLYSWQIHRHNTSAERADRGQPLASADQPSGVTSQCTQPLLVPPQRNFSFLRFGHDAAIEHAPRHHSLRAGTARVWLPWSIHASDARRSPTRNCTGPAYMIQRTGCASFLMRYLVPARIGVRERIEQNYHPQTLCAECA